LILTWSGWHALDAAFPGSTGITRLGFDRLPLGRVRLAPEPILTAAETVADPLRLPAEPVFALFDLDTGGSRFVHAALAVFWAVVVWGVLGGAIARQALVESAADVRIGLAAGIGFGLRKLVQTVTVPLTPLAGVGLLGLVCAGFGLLYRLPGAVGPTCAGALAFVPLLLGVPMFWLLAWLAAGWPLMIAAVAAEDSDSFDALSRSHGYVFHRPWRLAGYVLLAWGIGSGGLLLVVLAARLVLHLAAWGLAIGGPDAVIQAYFGPLAVHPESWAELLHSGWVALVSLLVYAWAFSYFWSAAGQVYLLLRHDVDGTPHEVVAGRPAAPSWGT
jgi:hypothetical protein